MGEEKRVLDLLERRRARPRKRQVSARAQSTFVEALDMDVLYAQSFSLGLDLRLLLRTPLQLLRYQATA